MATVMLLVEAALVAGLGTWMAVAVYDNWRHAKLNRDGVAMVMRFDIMERDYPDDFRLVAHRKVTNEGVITLAFQIIRLAETLAAVVLFAGVFGLLGAAFGTFDAEAARVFAMVGCAYFTLIWAGFIIGGNYFHYYYCHQWGQSNHFMFMYWGFFVLLVLMI
jgi:predicted small integral membrane protein